MLTVVPSAILEGALTCLTQEWIEGLVLGCDKHVAGQGKGDYILYSLLWILLHGGISQEVGSTRPEICYSLDGTPGLKDLDGQRDVRD